MIRVVVAIGIVALLLMVWFLLQPVGNSVGRLNDSALKFARCVDAHHDEIDVLMRQSGDVRSWSDIEYSQYRTKLKLQEIQGACLEQSGFKTLVSGELDNAAMSESEKASIRRELAEAQTFDDLERIVREIARSGHQR